MIKVIHRTPRCIGCHYCVDLLPEYYQMDYDQGRAILIGGEGNPSSLILPEIERALFEKVIHICPSDVIRVEDF